MKNGLKTLAVVLAVVLTTGGGIAWLAGSEEREAVRSCRTLVEGRLRSPGTAQWVGGESSPFGPSGGYWVRGYVDAENSFGAMRRARFSCSPDGNGGMRLDWFRER